MKNQQDFEAYADSIEAYQEEMFNLKANGLKVMSFKSWTKKKEIESNMFDDLLALRDDG
jgi:hypothetical protein